MLVLSWNVNGIKSALSKGLSDMIASGKYDAMFFQEAKSEMPGLLNSHYKQYGFMAKKKGYSGLIALVKEKPLSVTNGIGIEEFDNEGRVQTLEYEKFFLVNAYFPNSTRELTRLQFKLKFNDAILGYLNKLNESKPIVAVGDFNVAHEPDDIERSRENEGNAGYTEQERKWFSKLLSNGYVDTFRIFTKGKGHYSWWLYAFDARARNIGWRIDYCIVSEKIAGRVKSSKILSDITGSDHAPIVVDIDI